MWITIAKIAVGVALGAILVKESKGASEKYDSLRCKIVEFVRSPSAENARAAEEVEGAA